MGRLHPYEFHFLNQLPNNYYEGATTLAITTLSIMTFSIMTFNVMTMTLNMIISKKCHHNDAQHNDNEKMINKTQHYINRLSIMAERCYAECDFWRLSFWHLCLVSHTSLLCWVLLSWESWRHYQWSSSKLFFFKMRWKTKQKKINWFLIVDGMPPNPGSGKAHWSVWVASCPTLYNFLRS